MKRILNKLNKVFEHRVRLGIMSILMVNERADFNALKDALDVTDGSLASHIKYLEKEKFIEVHKQFIGRKPNTSYLATEKGEKAFTAHLDALEALLKMRD